MSFSISLQKPKAERLLNKYFVCVGKSLCIASNFEYKCLHLLRIHRITNAMEEGVSGDALATISTSFKAPPLANAIRELGQDYDISKDELAILMEAKDARNIIAHEAGAVDEVWQLSGTYIEERIETLRPLVNSVAEGEYLVGVRNYFVCERQPLPSYAPSDYVEQVMRWIFADTV